MPRKASRWKAPAIERKEPQLVHLTTTPANPAAVVE
jgi:hypothetical protein